MTGREKALAALLGSKMDLKISSTSVGNGEGTAPLTSRHHAGKGDPLTLADKVSLSRPAEIRGSLTPEALRSSWSSKRASLYAGRWMST